MLILYQFPISHYCEKVRWALDYKQLDYKTVNLLPGLHRFKTGKMACNSFLPILVERDKVLQGSDVILDYLDRSYPQYSLTPSDADLKRQALDWEIYADQQVGIHVRRICYHVLLDVPEVVIPFYTHRGPWYGPIVMKVGFPLLRKKMREMMDINERSAQQSSVALGQALDRIDRRLRETGYLVGDRFTRADLSVAALLAPLFRPKQYGLNWPERYPDALEKVIASHADQIGSIAEIYEKFR